MISAVWSADLQDEAEIRADLVTHCHHEMQRQFAFDTACQCADEASRSPGCNSQHGRYFRTDGCGPLANLAS